jgi:RNA polymerase sigma-70 factor (ECF subfamily)
MHSRSKYEESELVELLKERSEAAFHYLYDHYAGALQTVILAIVKDREMSSDVLQEVFVKIWRQVAQYDNTKGRLFTWMVNIARNASIDMLRSKGYKNTQKNQELPENVYQTTGGVETKPDNIGVRSFLQFLNPEHRAVLDLSYFQGFSHDEISKILQIPIGTVKTRIRAAVLQLRRFMNG